MAQGIVHTLTGSNVDEAIAAPHGLVVVDFWGYRCVPCARLLPIMEELAADYAGRAAFGALNVHENLETAIRFHIKSIPTLLLFKSAQLVATSSGWKPKDELRRLLDAHI